MKVEYLTASGHRSTAYLDEWTESEAVGPDKYTDEPVRLFWDGTDWREGT